MLEHTLSLELLMVLVLSARIGFIRYLTNLG